MKFGLGKQDRISKRSEISVIFKMGLRAGDGRLLLIGRPTEPAGASVRGAVLVSKRHGNAVRRNRIKRLGREALRRSRPDLPAGYDFLLLPRAGTQPTVSTLQASLMTLAKRIEKKAHRQDSQESP